MIVADLIKASMRVANVLEKGEVPENEEMFEALSALSSMLHSWGARRLMVRALVQEGFPLQAGKRQYTIGSSLTCDFRTSKPVTVSSAFLRDDNNIDTGIDVVSRDLYDSFQDKAISESRPTMLYYDPGSAQQSSQTGTLYLYNIPDSTSTYTLYIDSQKPFTDITSVNDVVTLEPPYEEAIKYELAIRLWREYHGDKPIPSDIMVLANEAMHTIETMNAVQLTCGLDLPGMKGQAYNIYMGGYND